MAKLSQLKRTNVISTSVEGVFIKDLPFKKTQAVLKAAGETGEHELRGVLVMFKDLICDAKGQPFDDAASIEDLEENMPSRLLNDIMQAVPEALNPSVDRLGK